MIKPEDLIGRVVDKVEVAKSMVFISFGDGTGISVSHDGVRKGLRSGYGGVLVETSVRR